jgi:hypothetical protein
VRALLACPSTGVRRSVERPAHRTKGGDMGIITLLVVLILILILLRLIA